MHKNTKYRIFPAKLLLFGEYTVLTGSESLAIPFPLFSFQLSDEVDSQYVSLIKSFYDYLRNIDFSEHACRFRSQEFLNQMNIGLGFYSEIPIGFGLGSSGAFTAAIYDRFFDKIINPDHVALKSVFARIESFFHGSSSGIDPLIIYLNRAVHFNPSGRIASFDFDKGGFDNYSFCLIDSGVERSTATYVSVFKEKIKNKDFRNRYILPLSRNNNHIIRNLLDKTPKSNLYNLFNQISQLQYSALPEMIISPVKEVWKTCLQNNEHRIKLCGAGGGGFYYLLSKDIRDFKSRFPDQKLINIF